LSQDETVVADERTGDEAEAGEAEVVDARRYQHIWEPETWGTDRVSRAIGNVSSMHMGTKLSVMVWRHAVKAIYRRYIQDKTIVEIMHQTDKDQDEEENKNDPMAAGFGHGPKLGENIYGRLISESMSSTETGRHLFRRISREWHAFCMFESTLREEKQVQKPARITMETAREATFEENRRWQAMRQVDVQGQLQQMLGEGARFRGVQEAALQAIMWQATPIVVIMGTGGGKSMLFMLPARCSSGLTVVIVPLVSLRNDIKDRCDALGIECVEWNSARPHEWASIVLVTPESAVGENFGHFINRQRAMGRLDRIVMDECHVVLDSGAGGAWRSRMLGLRGLVRAETQLVYLTATLRPADEAEFGTLVGLPCKGVHWFRAATTRGNVQYQIQRYSPSEETEEDVLAALVEQKKRQYQDGGKIIVYCDTVQKTEQYAQRLGAMCYHRNVGSAKEKKEIVRALREGTQQVFTATNALGLGVDAPTIRVVIHVGLVRRLRDYAQESGRAGRDGQASEAIIIRATPHDRRGKPVEESAEQAEKKGVEREMWEFLETKQCVRAVLDREMDGRADRVRCGEGEEACYRCAASAQTRRREEALYRMWENEGRTDPAGRSNAEQDGVGEPERSQEGPSNSTRQQSFQTDMDRNRAQKRQRKQEHMDAQSREDIEVTRLQEIMEQWSKGCTWCRATGAAEESVEQHTFRTCGNDGAEDMWKLRRQIQESIRWDPFSGCFDCGLPQSMCARYEAQDSGGFRRRRDGRCSYGGVLFDTIVSILGVSGAAGVAYFQERMQEGGRREGEIANMIRWMGRKIRWGGIESNEMCRSVVHLYCIIRDEEIG
jgi:superfamily II DNA helicase RecQ